MNKTILLFASCLFILFPFMVLAVASPSVLPPCVRDVSDFYCFKQNLQSIYENDNELFWKSWKSQENRAKSCASIPATSNFISLVKQCDGELAEAMAEFIEKLIMSRPDCFLSASEKLDNPVREHLIRYYVMTPLFHEDSEILPIIEKQLKKKNYPKFEKLYFEIKTGR